MHSPSCGPARMLTRSVRSFRSAGQWTFEATATDAAGNPAEQPLKYSWTIALLTELPYARFLEAPLSLTNNSEPGFSVQVQLFCKSKRLARRPQHLLRQANHTSCMRGTTTRTAILPSGDLQAQVRCTESCTGIFFVSCTLLCIPGTPEHRRHSSADF